MVRDQWHLRQTSNHIRRLRSHSVTPAGIYARISNDRGGSGLGVARQEADCRQLAETRQWTVHKVYVDNDTSAYRSKKPRPGYENLVADLKAGTITAVIAWHPDRLHRSPKELEAFIDVIDAAGAAVATVQAGDLDLATATGRMTARIVGAVARHESEHKAERQQRKHVELAQAGRPSGGGERPYGFNSDRVTIRESEAVIIREIAERLIAGDSLVGVSLDLNARGIPTATGGTWHRSHLSRMMTAGRLAGLREHRGEIVGRAVWPAILDRSTWETLVRILRDPNRRGPVPRKYLLTAGLTVCGLCEARLVSRPLRGKRRYVCDSGPLGVGCGKIGILAEPLEDLVASIVLDHLDGEGLAAAIGRKPEPDQPSSVSVAAELAAVEARLDEAATMFADGTIDRRGWLTARRRLEDRRSDLTALLVEPVRGAALGRLVGGAGLRERWETLSLDQRHAVIAAVVDRVVIGPAIQGRNFFDPGRLLPPRGDIVWRV